MQREIKFRAQDDCNGDWITGMPLYDADITGRLYIMYSYSDGIIVKPQTLGQFTGLTDKNGVEIYEGDMLRHKIGGLCYVVWEDAAFAVKSKGSDAVDWEHSSWYSDTEVRGNIHQHVHLL